MKIHIITMFPDAFESFSQTSMIGRAIEKDLLAISLYKLSDFSSKNFGHVDDKAYGMHGQVLSPEPLGLAIEHVFEKRDQKIPVIYMTPSGKLMNQEGLEGYYEKLQKSGSEFILICGHYEGIDQRIIDLYVDYQISIGEYVLTGGELAAQVFIDALSRFLPGVLGNKKSFEEDSFSEKFDRQKEYPVYTRPQIYKGKKVPEVLLSGDPKKIEIWKKDNLS